MTYFYHLSAQKLLVDSQLIKNHQRSSIILLACLLLTLAGMGKEGMSFNLWGPPNLDQLVEAMKSFVPNAAMVHTHSVLSMQGSDEASSASSVKFDYLYVPIVYTVVNIFVVLLRPCCSKVCDSVKEVVLNPGELSVVYICEFPEIKGKFDPVKAAKFGVEPGPKYAQMQCGNPVQSDNLDNTGNVVQVHPCQVVEPSIPGPIVLLVDCPTLSHLQELSSLESLIPYYLNTSEQPIDMCKKVNCLIHLSPAYVTNITAYEQWTTKFGEAQHIMAGHEPSRVAAKLNYPCPQFFLAPGFLSLKQLKSLPSVSKFRRELSLPASCRFIYAENLLKNILVIKIDDKRADYDVSTWDIVAIIIAIKDDF
ncbi:PREDICTED: ribonuclease Z 1-like [Nicotiana attenuata]|uniref:ribonuclease Z 1-like n=1 Tax=Nicotiana attenuata TaxID=49451 RepID=UPI00090560C4|nr:PREDICTED: ribonuclease Z 1-like [Nicotiana attenuata]